MNPAEPGVLRGRAAPASSPCSDHSGSCWAILLLRVPPIFPIAHEGSETDSIPYARSFSSREKIEKHRFLKKQCAGRQNAQ